MSGMALMTTAYGIVLTPIIAAIVHSLAVDWLTPEQAAWKKQMARLRRDARLAGTYVELSPEREQWIKQGEKA